MRVKFLADENISRLLIQAAMERGHGVVFLPKGTLDTVIFEHSKKEKLPILTFDTDFLDTAKFPLARTPGRIVLRIFPTIFSFQRERFNQFLTEILPTLDIVGKLVVISAYEVSVYKE